ncbi:MAG: glycosyltransferase [Tenericutes bacterium]|jgi:sucrose-phosphate synthase|nr:glycosyltransferase [Mycoplasmatota bacterium]
MRIVFLNPQGNFDRTDAFWTEHPDFGGQLVYVKEIAISLAHLGHRVDIITRQFDDEILNLFHNQFDVYDGVNGIRIIRIPCGANDFLKKEDLWEHLHEWVDNIITFYDKENKSIDFITTHYGDGGISGAMLSKKIKVPFSFTGHSLGAQKMDKLGMNESNMISLINQFEFGKRILAERTAIRYASRIFVSTKQEKDEQYAHRAYEDVASYKKDERFVIAPPGANLEVFSYDKPNKNEIDFHQKLELYLTRDIDSNRQNLPYIVSASRLDHKKNHIGLLKAYAKSSELQSIANIAISLRGVENAYLDYSNLKKDEKSIMDELMNIIIEHKLIGKVAFLNITSQAYLASSYRYFAKRKSVFTLTALYEPFGLAPIEAMAAGLPVAVTKYGGPSEVLKDNKSIYGILLDVKDTDKMIQGYIQTFENYDFYRKQGLKRVLETYNWLSTAKVYENSIKTVIKDPLETDITIPTFFMSPKSNLNQSKIIKTYYLEKEE